MTVHIRPRILAYLGGVAALGAGIGAGSNLASAGPVPAAPPFSHEIVSGIINASDGSQAVVSNAYTISPSGEIFVMTFPEFKRPAVVVFGNFIGTTSLNNFHTSMVDGIATVTVNLPVGLGEAGSYYTFIASEESP